ncbi:MAG TPA: choice-of-anchor tandem repeat GloVer-containing protein [Rhizomicrobium sp.]
MIRGRIRACCVAAGIAAVPARGSDVVVHTFQGGSDGANPQSPLISDQSNNLYGTTVQGGSGTNCHSGDSGGCGTVYRLAPDGTETVLYAFTGGCDGANPNGGLVADQAGNLYGTTAKGGDCSSDEGFGTVYKLAADGTETVLHSFSGGTDGEYPSSSLTIDRKDNLFGEAAGGGKNQCCGVVFRASPVGRLKVLHTFSGGSEGGIPAGGMIMDKSGNLYGTTSHGGGTGCNPSGCGTVFKLAPDGTLSVVYAFQGVSDGAFPEFGVVADRSGNLYGATVAEGAGRNGTVFKVTPEGTESVLYSFPFGSVYKPAAGVILDKVGNLYGLAATSQSRHCSECGLVFKITPNGTETQVGKFKGLGGRDPAASLLLKNEVLYGTAVVGGTFGYGVVFSMEK